MPPWSSTRSSPTPIPPTRRPTCAWPRSIAATASSTRRWKSLKKASAVVPDSLEVQYNMAVIDEAQGKYDDAIQILNQLLQKTEHADGQYSTPEKNNRAIFLERLGTVYREANKPQLAIDTFRKMFDLGRRQRDSRLPADHRDLSRPEAVAVGHQHRRRSGEEVSQRPPSADGRGLAARRYGESGVGDRAASRRC